jgi:hypothetical protein
MQLAGVGELLPPGSCIVCGNGNCAEGYIRFGVSLEFEGELYLCWFCVVQSAEILGCLIPAEAATLKEIAEGVASDNAVLRKKLEDANVRLSALDAILDRNFASLAGLSSLPDSSVSEESGDESQASGGSDNEPSGPDSEPIESTKGARPKRSLRTSASDATSAGIL